MRALIFLVHVTKAREGGEDFEAVCIRDKGVVVISILWMMTRDSISVHLQGPHPYLTG